MDDHPPRGRDDTVRVALVGLRGAGKTVVGAALARALGCPFHDSDAEIRRRTGRSAACWIEESGELEFRRQERTVVLDLAGGVGVLALGGGALLDPAARAALGDWRAVLLDASDAVLLSRARAPGAPRRPPLSPGTPGDQLGAQRRARMATYRELATLEIDTGTGTPDAVVERIQRWLAHGSSV